MNQLPFCLTVKAWSPTGMIALRAVPLALEPTEKVIVPLPMPLLAEVIVTHAVLDVAVHTHSSVVIRLKLPVPPAAEKELKVGLILYPQLSDARPA